MVSTAYEKLNSLPTIPLIAGSTITLRFNAKDANGTPIVITGGSAEIRLSRVGENVLALRVVGVIDQASSWYVTLSGALTEDLDGTYVYQPIMIDGVGKPNKPAQGLILIEPGIPAS